MPGGPSAGRPQRSGRAGLPNRGVGQTSEPLPALFRESAHRVWVLRRRGHPDTVRRDRVAVATSIDSRSIHRRKLCATGYVPPCASRHRAAIVARTARLLLGQIQNDRGVIGNPGEPFDVAIETIFNRRHQSRQNRCVIESVPDMAALRFNP